MAQLNVDNWKISGIASAVPSTVVENSEYKHLNSLSILSNFNS